MIKMIGNNLTIAEAAELFGLSRQRMHQLIGKYSVKTVEVHPRLKVVSRKELEKIPAVRPPGPRQNKPKKAS